MGTGDIVESPAPMLSTVRTLAPLLLALSGCPGPTDGSDELDQTGAVGLSDRTVRPDADGCPVARASTSAEQGCAALTIGLWADGTVTVSDAQPYVDSLPPPEQPVPRPIQFTDCASIGMVFAPTTSPGFTIEAVELLAARDRQAIQACWTAAGRPLLPRRSAARIEVAPSGEVARIRPDAFDRDDDGSLQACLARAVATWTLPPSETPICFQVPVGDASRAPIPPPSSRCRHTTIDELERTLAEFGPHSTACPGPVWVVESRGSWTVIRGALQRLVALPRRR